MELRFSKGMGVLIPCDEEAREWLAKQKLGAHFRVTIKQLANYKFLQKMHCLIDLAYEHFTEYGDPDIQWKGVKVMPSKERFRKDMTILAGHYEPTFNVRGELRMEAKSWSFGKSTDTQREQIFSSLIDACLKNVYKHQLTEAELRQQVAAILDFV